MLPKDTEVGITQSLGGSYTVVTNQGMFRIEAKEADALGLDVPVDKENAATPTETDLSPEERKERVWQQLKTVFDPEIPVNIVDLGLVYSMELAEAEKGVKALVRMTLTAPGCGMGPTIQNDAKTKVLGVPGVTEAEVEMVWDPPWNQGMITEEGKMKLGMI